MVAAKLAAVKDCEAQIKRGYFLPFNPDTAMASRRKSKKRKSDGLHNMGASDESATEGSGAASSATSTEAPLAPAAVQALSPQKRQYNGSDLTLGGICKRCCRLITAYTKAREELEKLEAAAAG